ncbi:hypothetical protein ACP70R_047368 [Stipagrostis hirtigluma subsp. patula]
MSSRASPSPLFDLVVPPPPPPPPPPALPSLRPHPPPPDAPPSIRWPHRFSLLPPDLSACAGDHEARCLGGVRSGREKCGQEDDEERVDLASLVGNKQIDIQGESSTSSWSPPEYARYKLRPTTSRCNRLKTSSRMSTSETSSNTSSSAVYFDDDSSTWWDMGGTIGLLAGVAASSSSGCGVQDAPLRLQELTGRQWVACNLADSKKCYENFCLSPAAFHLLHDTLVAHHGLKSTRYCDSIEALGMFLWACGTRQCQRQMADRFGRSMDTVSRKFGQVLDAMVSFADTVLKPRDPTFSTVHHKLQRFSPYFDGCIGAIDGTHIPVSVEEAAHDDFINRKGFTSLNVLVVCDLDMRFIFVATGKRGAAHDMAVFREAVTSSTKFPHPPKGKYYLVDSGYQLTEGYMAPYRKNRYHLSEFQAKGPENLCEIFNYHHSSIRSVIERSFGALKSKWQIMKGIPLYPREKQSNIILACFALHNFAMEHNDHEMNHQSPGQQIGIVQDWVAATANDDIATICDWIAAGLYGLA